MVLLGGSAAAVAGLSGCSLPLLLGEMEFVTCRGFFSSFFLRVFVCFSFNVYGVVLCVCVCVCVCVCS